VSCAGDILIEGKQLSQLTARLDFFRGWCFMHYLLPFSQAAARVAASRRNPLSHFGALYHAGARTTEIPKPHGLRLKKFRNSQLSAPRRRLPIAALSVG